MEIVTCEPLIYTIGHPDLTVLNFIGNSIGTQRVNGHSVFYYVLLRVCQKQMKAKCFAQNTCMLKQIIEIIHGLSHRCSGESAQLQSFHGPLTVQKI